MARILIADDAPMFRRLVSRFLSPHVVESVADGEQALEMLRTWQPDIALVDWMMPGLNGLEVCRAVRADPDLASIVLAIVTGLTDPDAEHQARLAGANHFMRKPITRRQLTDLTDLVEQRVTRPTFVEPERPTYEITADANRNRLLIRASGRPTETDLHAMAVQVKQVLGDLRPGYVVEADLRGVKFVNHANAVPLEQLQVTIASKSPSKIGTLLDDLLVQIQLSRTGSQAGILKMVPAVRRFTNERAWRSFLG